MVKFTNLNKASEMVAKRTNSRSAFVMTLIFLFILLGGFSTSAWGANVAQTTTTLALCDKNVIGNGSITANGITFTIGGGDITGNYITANYHYLKNSGNIAHLTWSVPAGYTIAVSKVTLEAKRYMKGYGYYYTTKKSTPDSLFLNNSNSWTTYTLGGGNSAYFSLYNGDTLFIKKTETEIDYKNIIFTYTLGNNYSIAFDANGGGGSMDNLSMAYYISKNLPENTFTRSYSVTYDENEGNAVDDAVATYSFAGWATSAEGDVAYADQASVSNLTETVNGTYTLYAKWSGGSVTLPTPTKADGSQFEGWYVGSIAPENKITTATYTPTADVTLVANWVPKYDFEITGNGEYTINNEAWNKTTAFNFVHADEEHMTTTIEHEDVISYNRTLNTITALKIGTSKITFTQNTSSTVNNGSIVFTIMVDSVANTLAVSGTEFSPYVDETIADVRIDGNSNGTISTTSSNPTLAYYDKDDNTIYIPNSDSQPLPFEDVTITISQAATAKYKYKKHTITLTVQKYSNDLTCSWGSWSKNVGFDSETDVTFGSDNDTETPIVVTPNPSSAIATYDGTNHKIVANYREGSVTWTVSQDEDYKYKAATSQTLTVNVGTEGSPDCKVLENQSGTEYTMYGLTCHEHTWEVENAAGVVTFEIMKNAGVDEGYKVQQYLDGEWSDVTDYKNDHSTSWGWKSETLNNAAKGVRFMLKGGSLNYVRNVSVSRAKYIDTKNTNGSAISSLDMPSRTLSGAATTATFYVDYSTCDGKIRLASNDSHITFANGTTSYQFDTEDSGRKAITLNYTSSSAETIAATITIYTKYEHETLTVNAETKGNLETHLVYLGNASYPADTTNIPVTELFKVVDENEDDVPGATITLGTSDPAKVAIDGTPNAIDPICSGTVTITASYAGDGVTYAAAPNLGTSITINKVDDEVSFDAGYGSMVVGEEINLSEWVTSCTSGSDITVTSVFPEFVVIEGGKVKAVKKGKGRLRAESAGNCAYNSGYTFMDINVRNAEDPCESSVLYASKLIKVGAYVHTSSSPVTYGIPEGPQDKLTFKVWRVPTATQEATLQILDQNDNVLPNGTIEYAASNLPSSEPDAPNKEINMADYPGAKKLRFYGWGTLNKYFSEVRISQKAYLTASTDAVTMSTVKACETATGQFTVSYSDVSHIQLEQTNDAFTYEVWDGETKLIGFNNACKDYGTYTVKFFYTPQAKGDYSNTVTISASGLSQTITLSGTANKPDRTIVWDIPTGNTITATQSLDLTAYARTSCQNPAGSVEYTASPADAVTIEGNHITFNKAATVTVTAHTVTSDDYNDAETVDKVWTVGKVGTEMTTLPTITSTITYGDNSSVVTYDNDSWVAKDTLSHSVVPGTIAYVGPASFDAAGATNLSFNFTPSDLTIYDAVPFTVPVTVQQKASVATPVAANITYGQRVNESLLSSGAGSTTDGTWAWKNEEANAQVLDVSADSYTGLNVIFTPDNSNYATIETTVSLKVDKADPAVTPQASAITYGQAISESSLTTASGEVDGTWSWAVDATEVLDAGEHNLTANFTSGNTNYNNLSNVAVTLTVNKATSVATPSAAAITAGQAVNTSALTNSGTAGSWAWDEAVANTTPAAGSYNYTVHFTPENANFTTLTTTVTLQVNAPMNEFTNEAGDGDWQNAENWSGKVVPTGEPDVIVSGALSIDENVTVGKLTIESTGSIAVITNGTLTVKGESESRSGYGDVHVLNDGAIALGNSARLEVRHFTLDAKLGDASNAAASGQVSGEGELHVNGEVYFKMSFDVSGQITYGWYDFVVPFEVDALNGVFDANGVQIVYGTDYIVMNHSEEKRARNQKEWNVFRGTMEPGRIYTITFEETKTWNTFLFKKKAGSDLVNSGTYTSDYSSAIGEAKDRGWNGFGNGTLQHRELTDLSGISKVQMYNHTENRYDIIDNVDWYSKALAVGTAFSIQVSSAQSVVLEEANAEKPLRAPSMEARTVDEFYLTLTESETEKTADRMWVSASEDATGEYVIGHDLLKMGTPTQAKVAQMWVCNNNMTLCDIEMPLVNDKANCSLGLYAPKAGSYSLAIERAPEDAMLYLTYNGRLIWNLSMNPYEFDLTAGTTEGYGLRLVAKAPQITTDIEETESAGQTMRKVIIDNKVYIVTPEGKMYDMIGNGIKF